MNIEVIVSNCNRCPTGGGYVVSTLVAWAGLYETALLARLQEGWEPNQLIEAQA
jgi:hypothetical protein